jgi:hypothetical protein
MPVEATARAVGMSKRRFLAIRSGAVLPRSARRVALAWEAIMFAQAAFDSNAVAAVVIPVGEREAALRRGRVTPEGLGMLKRYAEERLCISSRQGRCVVCGDTFEAGGRARYCSARCRKRAQRADGSRAQA